MRNRSITPVAIACLFALMLLVLLFQAIPASAEANKGKYHSNSATYSLISKSSLSSPMQQGIPPLTTTAQAQSGAVIAFETNNGISPTLSASLPYLVLRHEDGRLTPAISRTLVVTVSNVEVPLTGVTITIKIDTQDGDPDSGGNVGGAPIVPKRIVRARAGFSAIRST